MIEIATRHDIRGRITFPLEIVTQSVAILAKRRAGKSYLARRFVEQLLKYQCQVVIVDPKGDWWGLRSSADGKSAGFPVIVFGGEHGDVPLEVGSGEVIAKLVVEERVSILLDTSMMRKHQVSEFMGGEFGRHGSEGFLEALYRIKAKEQYRDPLMLVIDEADAIAPQKPQKGEERMLGAAEDIVRRGGQRGLGCTLICQRPAVLNKNVLTQSEIMIALRTIAPQDLDALEAWIEKHGSKEERDILMDSLPSLPIGDAWYWSPGWPTDKGIFNRGHTLPITTFDSGATPKAGEKRIEPKNLADIDIELLKRNMAATIERAKADDPKVLKAKIASLEAQLECIPAPIDSETHAELIAAGAQEVENRLRRYIDDVAEQARQLRQLLPVRVQITRPDGEYLLNIGSGVVEAIDGLVEAFKGEGIPHRDAAALVARHADDITAMNRQRFISPVEIMRMGEQGRAEALGASTLGKCERAILTVLAQQRAGCRASKLALLSGYRYSGSFKNSLSSLRKNGLMAGANTELMNITEKGIQALGSYVPMPKGKALQSFWLGHPSLGKSDRAALSVLIKHYPKALTGTQVAEYSGYEYSGSFKNSLSTLRTAGLLTGSSNTKPMSAADDLFS